MTHIAEKIRKVLAKADGSTHPEEAAAFMAKAHKLMAANGVSLMELGKLGDDPVGHTEAYHNNNNDPWRFYLGSALASYYGCTMVGTKVENDRYWTVYGRESARVTFELMWPFVDRQVMALARREHKAGKYKSIPTARTRIATALRFRIGTLHDRDTKPLEGNGVNALVPVDMVQAYMDDHVGEVRKLRSKSKLDANAVEVAKEVSLSEQVTPAAKNAKRIA